MSFLRRMLCVFLCVLLLPLPALAAEPDGEQAIVRDLIAYYFHYRDKAAGEMENQLQTLTSLNPEEGALWREIMDNWVWINEEMPVHTGILPDGLPEDDSLCIVVLGYGLNGDGSMKQELVDRLEVALASAEKYPQSYLLCTGGETGNGPGVSEAGQMGSWLLEKGLAHNRLILESESLSTTANAQNSCAILWRDYPQVSSIALVSSDYHIRWGSVCFSTMISCGVSRQGKPRLALVGNAGCDTGSADRDTMYSQAWGVSILGGVPFDGSYVPPLYMSEDADLPEPAAQPMPVSQPVTAQPEKKEPVVPVLLGLGLAFLLLFIPKKKRTGGSK